MDRRGYGKYATHTVAINMYAEQKVIIPISSRGQIIDGAEGLYYYCGVEINGVIVYKGALDQCLTYVKSNCSPNWQEDDKIHIFVLLVYDGDICEYVGEYRKKVGDIIATPGLYEAKKGHGVFEIRCSESECNELEIHCSKCNKIIASYPTEFFGTEKLLKELTAKCKFDHRFFICNDCFEKGDWRFCSYCGRLMYLKWEGIIAPKDNKDVMYCDIDCALKASCFQCYHGSCCHYFTNETKRHCDNHGLVLCDNCYTNYYHTCPKCGRYVKNVFSKEHNTPNCYECEFGEDDYDDDDDTQPNDKSVSAPKF